jgi:hypothetical protein
MAAILALSSAPCAAQNGSTADSLQLYATFECIGARAFYSGDADSDAIAHLEWRESGGPSWRRGVDLTRLSGSRWAGSVLWLRSKHVYDVRAVIEDPDGGSTIQGTITTREERAFALAGRVWWVAPNGSDLDPGTSTRPLVTIQAGVDRANPGDEVRVRPGIYDQTVDITRSGTAALPIRLIADAAGVILDGSNPADLMRGDWRDDAGGVFSIPFTDTTRLVCADSLQRLYRRVTVAGIRADSGGIAQGWAVESGRLSVKLEDRSSPNGHLMHVARFDQGIRVRAAHWFIEGLEIRCFGTTYNGQDPNEVPPAGILLDGAYDVIVRSNHVHTIGGRQIYTLRGGGECVIENNLLRDPRIGGWPWSATKGHEEEIQGVSIRGGRGHVVRYNTVDGTFDGIDTTNEFGDENSGADCDLHHNVVHGVTDDGIEPEAMAAINVRIWRNRVDDCFGGMSIAPITEGPIYILYNLLTDFRRHGFKFSHETDGHQWICHNTVQTDAANQPAVFPSGRYSNVHFRNNILVGTASPAVDDDPGESATGNDFDGDVLWSTTPTFFRWRGVNYTSIATLRAATGFEMSGRAANPQFTSSSADDYRLLPTSPAIDAGLVLAGINDGLYVGAAPDAGALEFGAPLDAGPTPNRATPALRLVGANPARGTVAFAAPGAGGRTLSVLDVTGRVVRRLSLDPEGHAHWNGANESDAASPAGIYWAVLAGRPEPIRFVWLR